MKATQTNPGNYPGNTFACDWCGKGGDFMCTFYHCFECTGIVDLCS